MQRHGGLRFGRRKAFVGDDEEFHGFRELCTTTQVEEKMRALFSAEQAKSSGALEAVTVYFELYGGCYPHPSVPSATRAPRRPVQPHLWYSPSVALAAFDVQLVFAPTSSRPARSPVFLGFDDACAALERVSLPFVPAAFRAPLGVALQWAFDHSADNALAYYNPSGLPLIEGNAGVLVKHSGIQCSNARPRVRCLISTGEGFVVRPVNEHTCPEGIQRALTKIKNPAFREIGLLDGGTPAARSGGGTTRATPRSPAELAADAAARYLLPARVASVASNQAFAVVSRVHAAALAELVVADALKEAEWDPSERSAVEARAGEDVFTRSALAAVHAYLDLCDSKPAVAAAASEAAGRSALTTVPTVAIVQRASGQGRGRGRRGRGTTVGASASRQAAPARSGAAFEPPHSLSAATPPDAAPPALPAAAPRQAPTVPPSVSSSSGRQVAAPSPFGRAPVRHDPRGLGAQPTVTALAAVASAVDSGDVPTVRFALAPALPAEKGAAARMFSTSRTTTVVASTAGATAAGAAALAAADALAACGWGPVECGERTGSAAFTSAALAAAEASLLAADNGKPTSVIATGATGTARPDRARSNRGRRPRQGTASVQKAVSPPQIPPPPSPSAPASHIADVSGASQLDDSHAAEPLCHPIPSSVPSASRWRDSYTTEPLVPSTTKASASGPGLPVSRWRTSQPAEPPPAPLRVIASGSGSGAPPSRSNGNSAAELPAPHAAVSGTSRWRESPSAGAPMPPSAAAGRGIGPGTIASRWRESESVPSRQAPRVGASAAPRWRVVRV